MPQDRFDYLAKGYFDPNPDQEKKPKAGGLLGGLRGELSEVQSNLSNVRIDPTGLDTQYRMEEARRLDRQRVNTENRIAQVEETGQDFAPTAPVRDAASSLGRGASSATIGFGGNLIGLSTQNFDNPLSKTNSAIQQWLDDNLTSEGLKQRRKIAEGRIAEAAQNGMGDEFLETLRQYGSDGALTTELIVSQIPNLIGPAAVGKVLAGGAIKSGVKKGASAAVVKAAAEKAAVRGAVGTASLMQGGDIAGDTYDRLLADNSGIWEMDEKFTQMVQEGASPEEAKRQRAGEISQRVGLAATALSVITQKYFPTAEKALAGSAVGKNRLARAGATALGETGSEMIEEGGGRLIQNVGVQSIDKGASLTEGIGSSAALGAIAAGPIGAGAGALSSAPSVPESDGRTDYGRLGEALDTVRTGPTAPEAPPALPAPANYDRTFSVDGLSMKGSDVMNFAEANRSDPRIARVLDQNVSEDIKLEQVARVLNGATAQRTMSDVVSTLSPLTDGKTKASDARAALSARMESIPAEVADANPALARLKELADQGNAQPKDIRSALQMFSPQRDVGTIFARPERGGDGSVLMTQEQKTEEALRERGAKQSFRILEARQRRYDQATAEGTQREDIRPGAPEPEDQIFLSEDHPTNPGAPATITASDRPGYARVQYETEEMAGGRPIIVSEEVPVEALMARVVRGSARQTQDVASRQRSVPDEVGTEMEGPRNSIDRASTKQVAPIPQPGTNIQPVTTPTERMPPSDVQTARDAGRAGNQERVGQTEQRRVTDQTEEQPQRNLPRAEKKPRVTAEKRGAVEYQPGVDENQPISVDRAGEATVRDSKTAPAGETETGAQPKSNPVEDNTAAEGVQAKTYRDSLEKAGGREPRKKQPKAEEPTAEGEMLDVEEHPRMVEHNQRFDDARDEIYDAENTTEVRKLAKSMLKRGLVSEDGLENMNERIADAERDFKFEEAQSALEEAVDEQRDVVGEEIADEVRSEDESYFSRRSAKQKSEPAPSVAMTEEEAVAEIKTALERLTGKGQAGRIAANRIRGLLKDGSYNNRQVLAAFVAADAVSSVLKGKTGIDVAFVPTMTDKDGVRAQGQFRAYDISRDGMKGIVEFSLDPDWASAAAQTGAHEAFHIIQRLLRSYDPQTFAALNRSFKDGMTVQDIHPSLRRALKAVKYPDGRAYWDVMTSEFGNQTWSGYGSDPNTITELQAYVFGYLHDAQRFGLQRKGLAVQFDKALSFFTDVFEAIGNAIRGMGLTSTAQLFSYASEGNLGRDGELVGDEGGEQFSARTRNMASLENTFRMLEKRTFNKGRDLKVFIQGRIKPALERAGLDVNDFKSTKLMKYLSESVVSDARFALQENANAVGWYDEKVSKALAVLSLVHPEVSADPKSRFAFIWALAVTSNGLKVNPNFALAEAAYRTYKSTGRMPSDVGIGTAADVIDKSLDLFNRMMSRFGFAELEMLMTTKASVKEIEAKTGLGVSGESKNEQVFGAAILGPKIGNGFFANLYGHFDQLTMDRWLTRTWGRWTGTLIVEDEKNTAKSSERLQALISGLNNADKNALNGIIRRDVDVDDISTIALAINKASVKPVLREQMNRIAVGHPDFLRSVLGAPKGNAKQVGIGDSIRKAGNALTKYIDGQKEAPAGPNERKFIRRVFRDALSILQSEYPQLTMADLQALLWYPEKRLYDAAKTDEVEEGYDDEIAPDYANAAVLIARNAGVGEESIREAIEGVDARRRSGVGTAAAGRADRGVYGEPTQFSRRPSPAEAPQAGSLRDGRGLRGGAGLLQAPDAAPLRGLPRKVKIPATGQVIQAGPYLGAKEAAAEYMRQAGLPYDPPRTYSKVNAERAQRVAAAYEAMPHDPSDPEVQASYEAMSRETLEQWRVIKSVVGLEVDFISDDNPYEASPRLAIEDVVQNNHMWVFPTDVGYGQAGITPEDEANNPLLAMAGEVIGGREARINDIFRIVHDFFGHAKEGVGFRADGEENAWRQHIAMYSPLARNAATVETRGQNSWLNYGPYGDANRTAKGDDTVYADQKIGKLPQWVVDEAAGDEQFSRRTVAPPSSIPLRSAPRFNDNSLNFGGQQVDTSPRAQTMDNIIYKLQDRYIDTKRVQRDIQKAGRTISERSDAYMAEELSSGRATSLSKNFLNRELNPLLQEMSQKGIKLVDLDKFLHARHAVERNAQIRKINPAMNAGSGMTDADATSYLNGLAPLRRRQLEQLAARVDGMVGETQRVMVAGGLDTQDTVDNWNRAYQNYVPLFREGFEDEEMSAGAGMSVRGGSSRRAMGSDRSVINVLSNIAQQRERAISRAERNRVGNALMGLALENPNDSFWFVVDPKGSNKTESVRKLVDFGIDPLDAEAVFAPPQERYIDQSTGEVIHRPNRLFSMADNVMATRINGEDRFIIFNPRNPQSKRMVEALKGAGNIEMMKMLSGVAKVTRYFAAINTQYNPAFGLYNLMRDLQGAALNLSSTPIAGKEAQVLRDSFPAMAGIYRELRQGRKGVTAQGQWEALAEEFESEGGKTGFRDLFANADDRSKAIERELSTGPLTATMKTAGAAFDWLSDFNETIENGVRLAAYKSAKDGGLSNAKAASVAKNLTVNFNRRGAVGAEVGALYAFFNASVQGTARMAQTITGPAGRKIVAGGLLLGAAQAVMLGLAGLDDEIPEWVKDRNVILPLGGGRYLAFPMPLGYHAIPAFSRRAISALGNDDPIQKDVIGMAGVIMDAFNPIGSGGSLLQMATPTVIDPLTALSENQDFAGRQIYQANMNGLDPTPGPDRNRAGVSPVGAALALAIDRLTGGSGYTPGAMSPTGDAVDYLIGQGTGGVGREIMKVTSVGRSIVTGEEIPSYKIPVVGRMIGNANESFSVSSRYYENVTEMNGHEREIEGRDEDGKNTAPYLEKNPEAALYSDVANYESEIRSLRKAKKAAETQEDRDLLDEEMLTLMMEVNQMVADAKRGG